MNPETVLANLEATSEINIYQVMINADQSFRALINLGIPIQYGFHTGGPKPIIIDSDDVADIEQVASQANLERTLQDYQQRIKCNYQAFSQFVTDRFSRNSIAMQTMMQIEIGWAFFYWCSLCRLYEEDRIPVAFSIKAGRKYFRGPHA